MKALFISDLHLCEERPGTVRAFLAFLQGPARSADALYILGDLFEYWAGDDEDAALAALVAGALRARSEAGTRLFFIAGNRDFLLGPEFASQCAMTRLADPTTIDLDGHRVLLSHGDALCTDDASYQTFRRQVREPAWQQAFLARPLAERKQLIAAVRQNSMLAKQGKDTGIMDVNEDAVASLLRSHGYPLLIHGHTHRPARHLHIVDDRCCERWVLSDWHDDGPFLVWTGEGLEVHRTCTPKI